jgi:soluble lytic murein transglycosylase
LQRSADTPLANRFLALYLREAGKAQRWPEFLQAMPGEPNSPDLKCYFFPRTAGAGQSRCSVGRRSPTLGGG